MASIAGLSGALGLTPAMPMPSMTRPTDTQPSLTPSFGGGGGGGGSAQEGLKQINQGSGVVSSAIGQAQGALGGGGGSGATGTGAMYKKGGAVKKKYASGGKIDLKNCGVSTASKNSKQSNW
tara:strand:+ start:15287 stop:15652 length:366 start_codon:yes stop_codon:yes gene_type:complete